MNNARFEQFSAAYRAGLLAAVSAPESGYHYGPDKVPEVADKMLAAIASKPMGVNYSGEGFKNACKALGIKSTRKAILEFLNSGPKQMPGDYWPNPGRPIMGKAVQS